jgi:hypothetical protein
MTATGKVMRREIRQALGSSPEGAQAGGQDAIQ